MNSLSIHRVYDADVGSPVLAGVRDYWLGLRGDRAMPTISQIDPIAIPSDLLAHLMLIDVDYGTGPGDRPRFRYRLIGTYVIEALGRENTGRYFDEVYPPEIYDDMTGGVTWLVEHGRPLRSTARAAYAGKGWLDVEFLLLPFSSDEWQDGRVVRIMMAVDAGPLADDVDDAGFVRAAEAALFSDDVA